MESEKRRIVALPNESGNLQYAMFHVEPAGIDSTTVLLRVRPDEESQRVCSIAQRTRFYEHHFLHFKHPNMFRHWIDR